MNFQDIRSLADMVRHRTEFLANTGSDVDHDTIAGMLAEADPDLEPDEMEDDEILSAWFDLLVERFSGRDTVEIHRHVTVPDWNGFIASIEAGATLGSHWSTDPDIRSPVYGGHLVEVLLSGTVDVATVGWFTTFQQHFAHPDEQEVFVEGDVSLATVVDLETGMRWQPDSPLDCSAAPYVEDDGSAVHPAIVSQSLQPHP